MSIYFRCFKLFYFCACTAVNMSGNMQTDMLLNNYLTDSVTFFNLDVPETCTSLQRDFKNSSVVINNVINLSSIFLQLSLNSKLQVFENKP